MPNALRLAGLTLLLMLALCAPASAASFVVNTPTDAHDFNVGDGQCDTGEDVSPAQCSLRAAVEEANELGGDHDITFDDDALEGQPVQLSLADGGAIEIESNVEIDGSGAFSTVISQERPDSGFGDRVFDISAGTTVVLRDLTIRDGQAHSGNGFFGGNIRSSGALTILNSEIANGTGDSAGGVANVGGSLTIERSTFQGNTAPTSPGSGGDAGAILNFGAEQPATTVIESSTISENGARLGGGIFSYNHAQNRVVIRNSTIAFNNSGDRGQGGGLVIGSGDAFVENSIVANNTSASPDNQNCSVDPSASLTSSGYNLESGTDCGFTEESDAQNTDPQLQSLDYNGGETRTNALDPSSPAIDTGNPDCPSEDQRGDPRPKNGVCDKGAFEADPAPFKLIESAGPLDRIWLGRDLSCQVHYVGDQNESFFGGNPGSCGTRLRLDGSNVEPSLSEQSDVTGSGTRSDPFKVVTAAGVINGDSETGFQTLSITRTDTYVVGDDYYRSDVEVNNQTGQAYSALLWHWADCYLQDSDVGYGYFDASSGGIYCSATANNSPAARIEGFVPVSGGARWFEGEYGEAGNPPAEGFPNTCLCDQSLDNGMGISWNFDLPAGGSVTRSFLTAFSPTGHVVDTTPPDTAITGGPSGPTNDSTPTFGFSSTESGSTFECSVDGGAFAACGSPHTTAPLGDGAHNFRVRATDSSGNLDQSPAERSFTVDTSPPATTIEGGPSGEIDDHTPTFTFSTPDAGSGFECSMDGGPFAPCSSPFTTSRLSAGKHTLAVRAVDAAGNPDPTPGMFEFEIQAQTVNELPAPKPGVTINVEEVAGTVLIGIPSNAAAARSGHASQKGIKFVPLSEAEQIPVGSFLDTTRGTVRLQSATNAAGKRQTGDFLSSIFQVRQSKRRSAKGLTDLVLKGGSFNRCGSATQGKRGKRASASLSRRTIRRLRANAQGRFRTSGRNSAATVRGTRWETIDRCDGTLTKVTRGTVVVRDFRKKKNVIVKAGKSYLARAKR
jgi:CSLREA domain-containing protein